MEESGSNIDVTSSASHTIHTEGTKSLSTLLNTLCNHSNTIRNHVTLSLSKTGFEDIDPSKLSGKGSTKVTKEYLAGSLIEFIKIVDGIDSIVNSQKLEEPIDIDNLNYSTKRDKNDFEKYLTDVQVRLDSYCSTMESNQTKFDDMVKVLSELVLPNNIHTNASASQPIQKPMEPNTVSPNTYTNVVCDPYVNYVEDAISESVDISLQAFIIENEAKFKTIGNRDTLYYGEYGYRYSGGEHKAQAMPPLLQELAQLVKPHMSNPNNVLNSCLITRYKDGSNFIPAHRDNEPVFNPESEIVTVSLGEKRTIKFSDNCKLKTENLVLDSRSILVTSRRAQEFWQHEIVKSDETCDVRYSLTFRHLAPHFLNSTAIVGDSNTKILKFGEGQGTFGKWLPGKRIEATHIENIPDPIKIGPYRNIILHTGINNIKTRNRQSNKALGNFLYQKCREILNVYPQSKVYLSLLLPTKLESLNYIVRDFNSILVDISHSYSNVKIIDHPLSELCDERGCLKPDLGRYDRELGAPLTKDTLHLGKKGLRLFAKSIKTGILGKFKSRAATSTGRGQHGVSAGGGINVSSQQS